MNHVPSEPVQEGPADWVVECSCGHRAEASHPSTSLGKHEQHVGVQQARSALQGGL